jgi:hypothetical protein
MIVTNEVAGLFPRTAKVTLMNANALGPQVTIVTLMNQKAASAPPLGADNRPHAEAIVRFRFD